MAFVSESLEAFLNEITREENEWADRQINKWEKGVPKEAESSEDILINPMDAPRPTSMREIQQQLAKISSYKEGKQISGEEFSNLCNWLGQLKSDFNPESLMIVLKMFLGQNDYIVQDLMSGGTEYGAGLESIMRQFGQIQ